MLDMLQPVHRIVLKRLIQSSILDGAWWHDCTQQSLRNFRTGGRMVTTTDPTLVTVPRHGIVHLDYLQVWYTACAHWNAYKYAISEITFEFCEVCLSEP